MNILTALIVIFGALTLLTGIVITIYPEAALTSVLVDFDKVKFHILSAAVRLVLGIVLITQASESAFPIIVQTIGCFCLAIAFSLTVMGRRNFDILITKVSQALIRFGRLVGAFTIVFGAFLIYAFAS